MASSIECECREVAGGVTRQEIDELRAGLASRAIVVDKLVERNAALAKVLDVYSRGVCLLHGSFTLKVPHQGALVPLTGPDGDPLEMEYLGSGFLASTRGRSR